jgi:hypothetical protein
MKKREIDKNIENQRENVLSTVFEKREGIRKRNDSVRLSHNLFWRLSSTIKNVEMLKDTFEQCTTYSSKPSREILKATGEIRVPYSACNPNTTPNDFRLFGNLKEKLQSVAVTDRDNLISAIIEIFSDTLQDELVAVYKNWMKRLHWVIENGGQCYTN